MSLGLDWLNKTNAMLIPIPSTKSLTFVDKENDEESSKSILLF